MHYWNPARLTGVGASPVEKNETRFVFCGPLEHGWVTWASTLPLVSAQLAGPVCPSWAEKSIHPCPQRSWAATESIYQAEVTGSSSSSILQARPRRAHEITILATATARLPACASRRRRGIQGRPEKKCLPGNATRPPPWLAAWATVKSSSCTRTRRVSVSSQPSTALHALEASADDVPTS
jgi:hypothetical protein